MERGINGICSQFCPAAPRGFRQFCGAGRGGARPAFCGAGRGSLFFRGAEWGGASIAAIESSLRKGLLTCSRVGKEEKGEKEEF